MFNEEAVKKGNVVRIEGILSEVNIEESTITKDNNVKPVVRGEVKVRVTQRIPGSNETKDYEIPVSIFACQTTNAGGKNPMYDMYMSLKTNFKTIAEYGIDEADRIRVTGNIVENNYFSPNTGKFISFPQVKGSFFNKVKKEEFVPDAKLTVTFVVKSKQFVTDADGVEDPNRFKVTGIVPQYGGTISILDFYAVTKNVIDGVSTYWEPGNTVKATCKLNFTSKVENRVVHSDFGDDDIEQTTVKVSELVIARGDAPLDEEFGYSINDVQDALKRRQIELAEKEEKAKNKNKAGSGNGGNNSFGGTDDPFKRLGF